MESARQGVKTWRMARLRTVSWLPAVLIFAIYVVKPLGKTFDAPQKSVEPRPFAHTAAGTDCNYLSKDGSKLWFRAYVDPSRSAATELFARLKIFYGTPTPIPGARGNIFLKGIAVPPQ
jgi:hypothetical protein